MKRFNSEDVCEGCKYQRICEIVKESIVKHTKKISGGLYSDMDIHTANVIASGVVKDICEFRHSQVIKPHKI